MNPDALLNRIRLEQRGLIDIHKKLYEMEHFLPLLTQCSLPKLPRARHFSARKARHICAICSFPSPTSRQSITTPRQPKYRASVCGQTPTTCVCCSLRCCRIKRSAMAASFFCYRFKRRWCKAGHFLTSPTA